MTWLERIIIRVNFNLAEVGLNIMKIGSIFSAKRWSRLFILFFITGISISAKAQNSLKPAGEGNKSYSLTLPSLADSSRLPVIKYFLSVYPDPATGNLNIKWENQPKGAAEVAIFDTAGTQVYTTRFAITPTSGQTQLDLSALKEGDYRITITSEKVSFYGKLSVLP